MTAALILEAMNERQLVELVYGGHLRIGEPHIFGAKGGVDQLLVYQTGGTSTKGGIPDWRRFDLPKISKLRRLVGRSFGPRPTERIGGWDVIYRQIA